MLSGSTYNGGFQERIIYYILYKDDDYIAFLFRNISSGVVGRERVGTAFPHKKLSGNGVPTREILYLKDLSTIYFKHVKMPYIEIFSGYEIWVRTLQQQQHSLKIVNSNSINLKVLSILYSLQCTKIIRLGLHYVVLCSTNFPCRVRI